MNFKGFAVADFTFPLLSHENSLKLISMLGMDGVDIGLFEGRSHLWPSKEFADLSAKAARLKTRLDDLGLRCADVFLQMDADFVPYAINHPGADRRGKARDWFERTLEYARAVGSEHATALPGVFFAETESAEDSWQRAADELAWRVERAAAAGIIFGVEAHVGSLAPDPAAALRLVEAVPGLTLTVDYTHFTRAGLPDAEAEPLLRHATHFHVRGAKEGRLQCNFSENTIDYARVVEAMKANDYSGWLGIEYVWIDWEDCNKSDNLSETIQFHNFLKERV
ncbi:MAG: sugar phosphate isomerase/epimerase family protein [Verrucomicrobiota bacterium]